MPIGDKPLPKDTPAEAQSKLNPVALSPQDHLLRFFSYEHLPENELRNVSKMCGDLANALANHLPPSPETTAGLRKLLEAKDCFVRAAL